MKKDFKILVLLALLISILGIVKVKAMSGEPQGKYRVKKHKRVENVEVIEDFKMPQLFGQSRQISIYLPPNYEETNKRYPVLYMQDGQQLFDNKTANYGGWKVDETINKLVKEGKTNGAIVVGIYNGSRRREYVPWANRGHEKNLCNLYLKWMVNNLKPYIDKHYRTKPGREHTGIAGSSLGGILALYGGLKYQDVFSRIGSFSTSYWAGLSREEMENSRGMKKGKIYDFVRKTEKKHEMKIYLHIGAKEGQDQDYNQALIENARDMYKFLEWVGFTEQELKLVVEGRHTEKTWAKVFPQAYLWLFEGEKTPGEF